ncbi:hypothetical protein [Stenotrophomonas sp.]|uniref:hypothetical protein n=1 Tax=Stenotrophomonas sp. TaxID=69392 RepID=UPI0028AA8B17|nr:hypothetical protein [Stenotrophomonas sp.]
MTDPQKPDPLLEWNRLSRENAENAIVSSMFEASSTAIEPIEAFVTWLLVGAAAVASFLLGNSDKLVAILGQRGFLWCGLLLAASCLFGLIAKTYLLKAEIGHRIGRAVAEVLPLQLKSHEETEERIQAAASQRGIELETGIRMERVLSEFLAPMPHFVKWLVARSLKKHGNSPQMAHLLRIESMNRLGLFSFLQSLAFLVFIVVGFVAAVT